MDAFQTDHRPEQPNQQVVHLCIQIIDNLRSLANGFEPPFSHPTEVATIVLQTNAPGLIKGYHPTTERSPAIGTDGKFRADQPGFRMVIACR